MFTSFINFYIKCKIVKLRLNSGKDYQLYPKTDTDNEIHFCRRNSWTDKVHQSCVLVDWRKTRSHTTFEERKKQLQTNSEKNSPTEHLPSRAKDSVDHLLSREESLILTWLTPAIAKKEMRLHPIEIQEYRSIKFYGPIWRKNWSWTRLKMGQHPELPIYTIGLIHYFQYRGRSNTVLVAQSHFPYDSTWVGFPEFLCDLCIPKHLTIMGSILPTIF